MIEGLKEIEKTLRNIGIMFTLLNGNPEQEVANYLSKLSVSPVVTDFSPLSFARKWRESIAKYLEKLDAPFYEVDTHNIVPVRFISQKQEYSAYTLRLKINSVLDEFFIKPEEITSFKLKNHFQKELIGLRLKSGFVKGFILRFFPQSILLEG